MLTILCRDLQPIWLRLMGQNKALAFHEARADWVLRFNAEGSGTGRPSILDDNKRQALRQVVEGGSIPAVHCVVRWCLIGLAQWVFDAFQVSISSKRSAASCAPCTSAARRK